MAARISKQVVEPKPPMATSIRFEPSVKAAIEKAARDDIRSVTSLVTKVMTDWLKERGYLK